jgi:hypothetical protein
MNKSLIFKQISVAVIDNINEVLPHIYRPAVFRYGSNPEVITLTYDDWAIEACTEEVSYIYVDHTCDDNECDLTMEDIIEILNKESDIYFSSFEEAMAASIEKNKKRLEKDRIEKEKSEKEQLNRLLAKYGKNNIDGI